MSLSYHQQVFTRNVARLITFANSRGIELTFGEVQRTADQQLLYYYGKQVVQEGNHLVLADAPKRTKRLKSNHIRKLAVDFNFFINGKLIYEHPFITEMGQYWEDLHEYNRWGGNFHSIEDAPHFEMNVL